MRVRLGDYIEQVRGVSYKPTDIRDNLNENSIAVLRANNIQETGMQFDDVVYIDRKRVNNKQIIKSGDIIVCASSGSKELVGKASQVYENKDITFGAFCKLIRTDKINKKYLGHYFNSPIYRREISSVSAGANINNIRNEHIDNLSISLPSLEEQKKIADALDKASELIALRKAQIEKMDLLIKAKFIEMFGDPVTNPMGWEVKKLEEIYEIIDGDRGINYPKQEEFFEREFCLFLNTGNVTTQGFSFNKTQFITEKKDKILRKGKLKRFDIVVTTRGTVGNIAYYDENIPFDNIRINSGMIILRKKEEINPKFFIQYFLNPTVYKSLISGTAQPQLPICNLRNAKIFYSSVNLQKEFADYVEQVEKQKEFMLQGLEKLEMNYKALMQEYFKEY